MPYMTAFDVKHPGRAPVSVDRVMGRMPTRTVRRDGLAGTPYKVVTDFSPMYGLGNIVEDITGVIRSLAQATGIINPLSYYEPGVPIPQVWTDYNAQVNYYLKEVRTLASATAMAPLEKEILALAALRDRIAPAFAGGATPGERDVERLGELVFGVRQWRKKWTDAKKQYGTRPAITVAPTPAPTAAAPVVAKSGMNVAAMIPWGLGIFLASKLLGGRKRRR